MRQREQRFEGRDPATVGADERLRQILSEDRDALRGEHDPETSRRRLMGLLAASAMPADGGGAVGTTSSWTAKLVSGKIFLNSVLALLLSGGVTFILLDSSDADPAESSVVPRTETVREHPSEEPVPPQSKAGPLGGAGETVVEKAKERSETGSAENRLSADAPLSLPVSRADAGLDADPKEQVQTSPAETSRIITRKRNRLHLQMKVDSIRKE